MTAPATLRRVFVGPVGIRAGWRLLLFVVLAQGLIGLPLQWFVVRVLRLGDGGEWTAPGFILAETVGGLGIIPTFAAAWLMSRMERRPFGAYGLPSRGRMGAVGRRTRARGATVGDRDDAHRARRGVRVPRLPAVHAGVEDRLLAGGRAALAPVRRAALLPQADGGSGGLRERCADRSVSVPDVAAHR